MILYHGSKEVVEYPEIRKAVFNKDFYFGFYCTEYKMQAERWATRYGNKGYVNKYDYVPNAELKYLKFDTMTEEWLDFIVESRLGNKPWLKYDYIESGVANDRVIDTINLYMADLMTRDVAIGRLAEHRPNNQMCILNQEIIDKYLEYNGTV